MLTRISGVLKTITLEPVIFFFLVGTFILNGAQIPTNILIYKICHVELNHTEEICANLGNDAYNGIENDVQIRVNNFQTNAIWISSAPAVIFSLYAGPLSDNLGRKPLIMIPLLGFLFTAISGIINFAFIKVLPLEFFYLETISSFFGGFSIYYLGIYSYGASISEPKDRAHRIARLDGTETISTVIGTLLSPIISEKLTYYGSYGLYGGMIVLAALYLKFFVREPIKKKKDESKNSKEKRSAYNVLYSTLVTPLIDIKTLVVKKRKNILTIIIILQLIIYAVYVFAYYSNGLLYLYMLVKFEGFTAADYSYFTVAISLGNTFFLVIFMPIVSGKFGMNDALLMTIISIAETLSLVVSPFITSLPLFYASQMLSTIGYCKYSVGRSLLSKSCEPDEMGKLFSIQTVLISLASMACNPIVRKVYNETLKSFPGAFMLLSASLLLLSGFGNLFIYTNRKELKQSNQEELEEDIKDKIDLAAIDAKNITTYM